MTLDVHLCYINCTLGQQHPQVAPVGKAEKTEEKFCMQNINIIEPLTSCILLLIPNAVASAMPLGTSLKLFPSIHKVKAVCWSKGLGWAILPYLTQNKWTTGLKVSPKACLKGQIWGLCVNTALTSWATNMQGSALSPVTLPEEECPSRTVSWAHFLALTWVSLEKPHISICKKEITNLLHFPSSL